MKVIGLLAGVWLVAGGIMWWANHAKPTPESIERYLAAHPLDGKSASERSQTVEEIAERLNGLSYEDRREFRMRRKLDGFFRSLNPEEQSRFLDLTLPTGFKQMMESFNKMTPERRKQLVQRALADMEKQEGKGAPPSMDNPYTQKMMQEGLRSFYSDASAEVKMDFAPLIEQMQKNLPWQGGR